MEKTLEEISKRSRKIRRHKEYSQAVRNMFMSYLNEEALRHSVDMEVTEEKKRRLSRKQLREEKKKALFNLNAASDFLEEKGLSLYTLSMLGKMIEPEKNISPIRFKAVTYGDMFEPPSPSTIYNHLDNLVYSLESLKGEHSVIRAARAHLGMVEIHPFMDGNGRAARLLQNYCLKEKGLPPAVISSEESEFYRGLVSAVMHERESQPGTIFNSSLPERNFSLYIATKVLRSLGDLEKELSTKNNYTIFLENVNNKEILFRVKNELAGMAQSQTDSGFKVSKSSLSKSYAELQYQGGVSSDFFNSLLERLSKKYRFKYKIVES